MVHPMRRSLVVALGFASTLACSYLVELPATSTIAPIEDGAPADDAGEADDASPEDDGPPPYDAPPVVPFCESRTSPSLYCADFDETPAPDMASIGAAQIDGGQLVLSNAVSLSPPRSLLATARGDASAAFVTRPLGESPDGVTLSFDLLVSAWATAAGELSGIELAEGPSQCVVRIDGAASTWSVTQVCGAGGLETARQTTASASPIVRGQWQRFALRVTFAPSTTVSLDVDGVRVVEAPGVLPLQRAPTTITLGAKLVPSGSVTMFQDNVLVTTP